MGTQREQWLTGSHTQACRGRQVPAWAGGLQDAGRHVEEGDQGTKQRFWAQVRDRALLYSFPSPEDPLCSRRATLLQYPPVHPPQRGHHPARCEGETLKGMPSVPAEGTYLEGELELRGSALITGTARNPGG